MRPSVVSEVITPQERFREIARLLGLGLLRLHARAALASREPENFTEKGLAVSAEQSVTVHTS
ncbi:MAG: hypothetical protein K2X38_03330 [Gemmataceae bacterium]|nr:hypothetical protein [Gemmataceae bacterium]